MMFMVMSVTKEECSRLKMPAAESFYPKPDLGRRLVRIARVPDARADNFLIGVSLAIQKYFEAAKEPTPSEIRSAIADLADKLEAALVGRVSGSEQAIAAFASLPIAARR